MNCEIYDDLLDDYVDGARASDRPGDLKLAAFEEHLAGCERCQALVADFTSIRRTASVLEDYVPPPRSVGQDCLIHRRGTGATVVAACPRQCIVGMGAGRGRRVAGASDRRRDVDRVERCAGRGAATGDRRAGRFHRGAR